MTRNTGNARSGDGGSTIWRMPKALTTKRRPKLDWGSFIRYEEGWERPTFIGVFIPVPNFDACSHAGCIKS